MSDRFPTHPELDDEGFVEWFAAQQRWMGQWIELQQAWTQAWLTWQMGWWQAPQFEGEEFLPLQTPWDAQAERAGHEA